MKILYVYLLANASLMLSHKTFVLSWAKLCVNNSGGVPVVNVSGAKALSCYGCLYFMAGTSVKIIVNLSFCMLWIYVREWRYSMTYS
jgi:hypothetical protein